MWEFVDIIQEFAIFIRYIILLNPLQKRQETVIKCLLHVFFLFFRFYWNTFPIISNLNLNKSKATQCKGRRHKTKRTDKLNYFFYSFISNEKTREKFCTNTCLRFCLLLYNIFFYIIFALMLIIIYFIYYYFFCINFY